MFIAHSNLQLLSSILVLLGPLSIVLPVKNLGQRLTLRDRGDHGRENSNLLHDLAALNNTFDFLNQERANTHYKGILSALLVVNNGRD
jgi:hypothetical protein